MNLGLLITIIAALLLKDVLKHFLLMGLNAFNEWSFKHDLRNFGLKPTDRRFIKDERNQARWEEKAEK